MQGCRPSRIPDIVSSEPPLRAESRSKLFQVHRPYSQHLSARGCQPIAFISVDFFRSRADSVKENCLQPWRGNLRPFILNHRIGLFVRWKLLVASNRLVRSVFHGSSPNNLKSTTAEQRQRF